MPSASFHTFGCVVLMLAAVPASGCGDDDSSADPAGAGASGSASTSGTTGGAGGSGGEGGEAGCPPGSHPAADACEATLTGWTDGPPLANKRDHHLTFVAVAESGPFLYAAGGVVDNGDLLDGIESAAIQPDGSLGPWSATSTLPQVAAGAGVAVVGSSIIVSGGYRLTSGGNPTLSSATDVGVLAADGTIGGWTVGPKLAETRFHHSMVADAANLYVIGGLTGDNTDNTPRVEHAVVGEGSVVGAWSDVTPLPAKRSHHSAVIHDGAIFVTGGLEGDPNSATYTTFTEVLRAPILVDGALGNWAVVGQLPMALTTHASLVHAGSLYVLGGIEGDSHNVATVRRAPIGADGMLGAWEELAPLPTARAHAHQTPLYQGFVYAAGGALDHASMPDVYIGRFE
ncbi:MAG: hypothetical protein WKG00_22645 [Polyangiaceae bacterium]